MLITRFLPVLISMLASAGLWVFGLSLIPQENGDSYAALVYSVATPDSEIVERLENHGFTGLVAESDQWVLLDCFNGIEQVPLTEYHKRLLPFDPRYDSYAEKLNSLFTRDDERVIYIPITAAAPVYEQKIVAALDDIPHSFEYARTKDFQFFIPALFILALSAFFIIRPLRLALRPDAVCLIPCLPALTPLVLAGPAGFALASLLTGFAVLLANPILERLAARRRPGLRTAGSAASRFFALKQPPHIPRWLPLAMVVCYGVIAFFSGFSLVFTLAALLLFCGVFAFSLWISADAYTGNVSGDSALTAHTGRGFGGLLNKRQIQGHRRFAPVPILSRRRVSFAFSWAMLPFAVIAAALIFAPAPDSQPADFSFLPPVGTVTEEDYYHHYVFQSTFSLVPLNVDREANLPHISGDVPRMSAYEFAPDGLPYLLDTESAAELLLSGMPPFPLGDFIRYLDTAGAIHHETIRESELLFVLLPLIFILPALTRRNAVRHGKGTSGFSVLFPLEAAKERTRRSPLYEPEVY